MRLIDRDLIRGGHYGQRSCEPHQQAEHMAAPTNAALVKKVLANSEPSTHGPKRTRRPPIAAAAFGGKAHIPSRLLLRRDRMRRFVEGTDQRTHAPQQKASYSITSSAKV